MKSNSWKWRTTICCSKQFTPNDVVVGRGGERKHRYWMELNKTDWITATYLCCGTATEFRRNTKHLHGNMLQAKAHACHWGIMVWLKRRATSKKWSLLTCHKFSVHIFLKYRTKNFQFSWNYLFIVNTFRWYFKNLFIVPHHLKQLVGLNSCNFQKIILIMIKETNAAIHI